MSDDPNTYLAAQVDFLDRDSGKVNKTMCYPITRIELMNWSDDRGIESAQVFVVKDGKWVQEVH